LINDLSLNRNEEACGNQVYVISSGREWFKWGGGHSKGRCLKQSIVREEGLSVQWKGCWRNGVRKMMLHNWMKNSEGNKHGAVPP
jgi:hypothetical protein